MINSVIRLSVENRGLVLVMFIALMAAGSWALRNTPVDAIPDLSDVQVIVKTPYPGQAPSVVQEQVTYPLTSALLSVPGAETVRGFSFFGDSYIYVLFSDDTDLYWARSRVLEYLNQAARDLPEGVRPELGPDASGVGWVYLYGLRDRTGKTDLAELTRLQDWFLRFELQAVEGVSEVATVGGMKKQYQVEADPEKMKAYGVTLDMLRNAIRESGNETGASVLEMAEAEYMVRTTGYIQDTESLGKVPLGTHRESASGPLPLLIEDVADVRTGPEIRRGIAELNGEGESVGGIVVMRYGENADKVIERVKERLDTLKNSLPDGVEIVTVYDRSTLINRAVDNLWDKLAEELLMVALVCMIFLLHARSALVAMISLPAGILIAFIIMKFQGLNANIMSLGGIAIAIGAMIDGAIVMIENMHKHASETELTEKNRWQVVIKSASEVGPSLFFSLLIVTVSFLPVFTLEAQEGKLFAPLAYTKTYAMAAAAFLSITLVPVLMGLFVRGRILPEKRNPINRILIAAYRPVLKGVTRYPVAVVIASALVFFAALIPASKIGSEFMPDLDEGDLMYMPTTYPGLSIGKAREILQQTDKLIATVPEVETVFGKIGRADTATDPAPLTMIETFIQLKPKSEWREGLTTDDLRAELESLVKFPGLSNAWVMPIKTRIDMLATGIKTPLGIKVAGPDPEVLENIGQHLEQVMQDLPDTLSVYSERAASGRYLMIEPNRLAAADYGLSVHDIQDFIATAVGGRIVATTTEGAERYSINLRYPQDYRNSPEALREIPFLLDSGQWITLGDVATIRIDDGPSMLKSENVQLNNWTFIDVTSSDIGGYVERADKLLKENLKLPPGYSYRWAGQFEYLERAKEKLTYVVPLTLLLIGMLLYFNFRRMTDVWLVVSVLPLALTGGVLLMYWLGFNYSVATGVGFIALAGVATETAVIMLQFLKQDHIKGAVTRIRPVTMTAIATIAGLIPVMIGDGTGSEIMSRIAAPMAGGMLTAMIATLVLLPALYVLVTRKEAGDTDTADQR